MQGHSRDIYHTKRMQRLTSVLWSMDDRYIYSASDEMNIRIWKARASEKLGVVTFLLLYMISIDNSRIISFSLRKECIKVPNLLTDLPYKNNKISYYIIIILRYFVVLNR